MLLHFWVLYFNERHQYNRGTLRRLWTSNVNTRGLWQEYYPLLEHVDTNNVTGKRRQSEDAEMTNTESHPILDENTCPRTNTVKRLADILDEEWVVLVRGTPSTGKTTLAHLLRDYYKARGDPVVYIRGWKEDLDATSYLTSRCKRAGYPGIRIDFFLNVDVIFILDEAQDSYFDLDLWDFIKAKNDQRRGPKFCLFSSYGSPANGMVINKQRFTPPFLGPTKRVSIICSPIASSPDICLFYNEAEFEDVVRRYCMDPTTPLSLHKDAQKYLLSMTCGHPGAVASMLSYIFKVFISRSFQVDERLMAIDIWICIQAWLHSTDH